MGMLYRRKKKDPVTGKLVETGPWWMKYYDCGKPYFQSTGKVEKREALSVLKKVEAKVLDGQREGPQIHRTRFEDLVVLLQQEYALKNRKTWIRREQNIAHLKKVFGGIRVKAIASDKLQGYVQRRLNEGVSPATVNRELDCLHRMMVLGTRQTPQKVGRIPHFPKLTEDNVREGFFDHEEFLALRGAATDHLKIAMTIGYYTGMRRGEIIGDKGVRWEQVDFDSNCIRLASSQTKTKTPRIIYMCEDFLRVIKRAKELRDRLYPHCPYVCHRNGKPFYELLHGWYAACQRVGIVGKTFHDLRRTAIRNLVRAGVPETVTMRISGHKTRSVFDRYNVTSEEDLQQAANQLNRYFQKKMVTIPVTQPQLTDWVWGKEASQPIENIGGEGGIRTHGPFQDNGFRDGRYHKIYGQDEKKV
jgi:integrase